MGITSPNAGAEGSAGSGNITLGAPASPSNGDIWIAVVHSSDQVTHSFTGWTQIAQGNGGGTTSHISVWYFRYAGSAPNLVVTHSAGASPIGGIRAFRGCKASGSPAGSVGVILGGTDGSIESNAITPTIQGSCLLVCNGSADDNNRTALGGDYAVAFEDTAGGTQNCYQTTAGNPDGSVCLFYDLSVPDTSVNPTVTQAAVDAWASVVIELLAEPVNNTITGEVTAAAAVAATMAYNKHPQIAGAVVAAASVAAGMLYTPASGAEIVGNVTASASVAAAMAYNKHPALVGACTASATVAGTMAYNRNASILGAVTATAEVLAGMAYNRHASIVGSVTAQANIAGGMQYQSYGDDGSGRRRRIGGAAKWQIQ